MVLHFSSVPELIRPTGAVPGEVLVGEWRCEGHVRLLQEGMYSFTARISEYGNLRVQKWQISPTKKKLDVDEC